MYSRVYIVVEIPEIDARYCHSFLPSWRAEAPLIIPVPSISPSTIRLLSFQNINAKNNHLTTVPSSRHDRCRPFPLDFSPRVTPQFTNDEKESGMQGTFQTQRGTARTKANGRFVIKVVIYYDRHYLVTIITSP